VWRSDGGFWGAGTLRFLVSAILGLLRHESKDMDDSR
jgi:hypothetical protein